MAEGGPPPEVDLHLLECPICLEQLQQPKSLPCLHSFCQDCLGTYISKELSGEMASATSFPCPICRRTTSPVKQAETKDTWAEQFPTNNVIKDLIQLRKHSPEPLYCKPCQTKGNLNNPAQFWCKSMKENFCEECKVKLHDTIHSDCGIIDITVNENIRVQLRSSAHRCDQHDEKLVWYCEDHQLLGCNICAFKDHRRCEEISTVTEYFLALTAGTKLEEMRAALKRGTDMMNSLVKDFEEQIKAMVAKQEIALQSISDLRAKVERRLNKLQKDITDELIMLFKEEKRQKEASLQQCERLMKGMVNTLKSSIKAVEENDSIETIVLYQRGQAEVESCKTLVTEMSKTFTSVSIEHQIVSGHDIISDNAMGKIVVNNEPRSFPCHQCDRTSPLSKRHAKEIRRFNIKSTSDKNGCCIAGVVYLPSAQIVVSDYNNEKLKLFKDKGQYLYELTVCGNPRDMCLVDNNTVAVAVSNPGRVFIVNVKDAKLSLSSVISMPNGKDCHGITHTERGFVVSSGREVYNVTPGGGAVELLYTYNRQCWSLAHDPMKGDTFVSVGNRDRGNVVMSLLSTDKRRTDVMKVGVVSSARGVDVDREGIIYVCGMGSHNIVQIARDGTHVRELLTSSDGIDSPRAISVRSDTFVVTDIGDTDERDYIRVYVTNVW